MFGGVEKIFGSLIDFKPLTNFISQVKKCETKEKERVRILQELADIRKSFSQKNLKPADRKKCILKMLYIFMLDNFKNEYDVQSARIESIGLLASDPDKNIDEKQVGYLACGLLLDENMDILRLTTERCRVDLLNQKSPQTQCLALTMVGNLGGREQAETLTIEIKKVLVSPDSTSPVRKKAALALLKMFRKNPESTQFEDSNFNSKLSTLLKSKDLGVVLSLLALLCDLCESKQTTNQFMPCIKGCIELMYSLLIQKQYLARYLYYSVPCPWVIVKCLKLLQNYDHPSVLFPAEENESNKAITNCLNEIIKNNIEVMKHLSHVHKVTGESGTNRHNALHSVFFETANLLVHYDNDEASLATCAETLLTLISDTKNNTVDPNLRYLSLQALSRVCGSHFKKVMEVVRGHSEEILNCIKESDVSIKRRALGLLYNLCDKENVFAITESLLKSIPVASDVYYREEAVLKISLLAEKHCPSLLWYVNTIADLLQISAMCGMTSLSGRSSLDSDNVDSETEVANDVWHRVCALVCSCQDEEMQKQCVSSIVKKVIDLKGNLAAEALICMCSFLLGEFGDLVAGSGVHCSPENQIRLMLQLVDLVSVKTRPLILDTLLKLHNVFSGEKGDKVSLAITKIFKKYSTSIDIEIQQRCLEYLSLTSGEIDPEIVDTVLAPIPPPDLSLHTLDTVDEKNLPNLAKETQNDDPTTEESFENQKENTENEQQNKKDTQQKQEKKEETSNFFSFMDEGNKTGSEKEKEKAKASNVTNMLDDILSGSNVGTKKKEENILDFL